MSKRTKQEKLLTTVLAVVLAVCYCCGIASMDEIPYKSEKLEISSSLER